MTTQPNGAALAQSPKYKVWTPPEIWAPIDPPSYVLGSIVAGDVAMVNAHGSSLKSWLGIDAVISAAAGVQWLDRFRCQPGEALFLDFEMGADECRRRVQRCALAKGRSGPVPGVFLVSMPPFNLTQKDGIGEVRRLATGRRLIVCDSLSAGSPDVDENDARFADPLKRMKDIGEATGCAFLVAHHSRKARDGADDERERPRGTSALFAACDSVFQLARADDGGFLVRQTKARRGKALDPFVLRVDDVPGAEATRVYAEDPATQDERAILDADSELERAKGAIIVLLGTNHDVKSANDVSRRIRGFQRRRLLDAVKELRERGLVVEHKGALRLASEVQA